MTQNPNSGASTVFPTVGLVGVGQMGVGIAQVIAMSGRCVVLGDVDLPRAEAGRARVERELERRAAAGRCASEAFRDAAKRVSAVAFPNGFARCDLVIETISEQADAKITVLKELCPHLKPEAVIGTNTSSISITRLAAATDRPGRFLGIHFMNPAPKMELVELVRGIVTEAATFEAAQRFVADVGKTVAVSEDFPAFMVNRVLLPMINEAVYTLYEGVGTVEAIDTSLRLGARHPMGPLELADFIGLDTCLAIMHVLQDGLGDSKYRPCPLLVKYVEAGWLGRKTKRGFYDYRSGTPKPTR